MNADSAVLTVEQVQEIRDCEGTLSHSMEWDTCALALAASHELLRRAVRERDAEIAALKDVLAPFARMGATFLKQRPLQPSGDDAMYTRHVDDSGPVEITVNHLLAAHRAASRQP